MDVRSLIQNLSINEVEREAESSDKPAAINDENPPDEDVEESSVFPGDESRRWMKLEVTEEKLDELDGLRRMSKKKHSSVEEHLQLPDDYDERKNDPGKKRVRWADLEQKRDHRHRAPGFAAGQKIWNKWIL